MDRKLITFAIVFLFLQVGVLLYDTGFLFGWQEQNQSQKQELIGQIIYKQENVKRKSLGSVVWEDSESADTLNAFDSVLTLDNSSAQLKLKDDIEIQLQSNTLVVLEPEEKQNANSLHIRFSRGDLFSQNKKRKLSIGHGEWSIEAKPGTGINLKSLQGEEVEVEVTKGSVDLVNNKNPLIRKEVTSGSRLSLLKNSISPATSISQNLYFENPKQEHIYAHSFPVQHTIRWVGKAQKIRVIDKNKNIDWLSLEPLQQSVDYAFDEGIYYLSLFNESQVSQEMLLKIISAPRIKYTSPLPRDRFEKNTPILFGWLTTEGVTQYKLKLVTPSTETQNFKALTNATTQVPAIEGEIQMSVEGYDPMGFRVPAFYSQTIYVLPDPLAPPQIKKPDLRMPSNAPPEEKSLEQKSKTEGASNFKHWQQKIWFWLLPQAMAQEFDDEPQKNMVLSTQSVQFEWLAVPGADFYNIEISSSADFQKPELMSKVEGTQFVWRKFPLGAYYWRVAAGANSGRMGLFSEPAYVDLRNLTPESKEISTGVTLLKPEAKPIKKIVQMTATTTVAPTVVSPPTPTENTIEPPVKAAETTELTNTTITGYAQANVIYNSYTYENTFSSALSGFSDYSVTLGFSIMQKSKNSIYFSLQHDRVTWQAADNTALPYQMGFEINEFYPNFTYVPVESDFNFGLGGATFTYFARSGLETLSYEARMLWGPTIGYQTVISKNLKFSTRGGLFYGQNVGAVSSQNNLKYILNKSTHPYYSGGGLDFQLFFGKSSTSGSTLKTGLFIGREF